MNRTAILALATAASALASAAAALAEDYGNGAASPAADVKTNEGGEAGGGATEAPKKGKRGASAEPKEEKKSDAKTYEEMREVIKPLVEEGRGEEVKKVIAKYSSGGLKELPEDKQGAFIKDIEALTL